MVLDLHWFATLAFLTNDAISLIELRSGTFKVSDIFHWWDNLCFLFPMKRCKIQMQVIFSWWNLAFITVVARNSFARTGSWRPLAVRFSTGQIKHLFKTKYIIRKAVCCSVGNRYAITLRLAMYVKYVITQLSQFIYYRYIEKCCATTKPHVKVISAMSPSRN